MGLNFSINELIHVHFSSELKNLVAYCVFLVYIVLHDFNLTYFSSIILGSFSILLFPKLCWHIGLTPTAEFPLEILQETAALLGLDQLLIQGIIPKLMVSWSESIVH